MKRRMWPLIGMVGILLLSLSSIADRITEYKYSLLAAIGFIALPFVLIYLFLELKWLFSSDKDSKNKRNITGQPNEEQSEQKE